MAQPISPMLWNKAAIADNRLLPARYSIGIFTGKDVKIANNQEAYAYDDILVSDRIFDYDDRRLNGLAGTNADGHDGWGASSYGPFQTVRFTRRVFTSGQHKSIAWRVFDEKQYSGGIGEWGTATSSNAYTGGESYMSTVETINKAKKIWDAEILGPWIDKYNFFAIANGHIAGRWVQKDAYKGEMFTGAGQWIACPGPYEGLSFQPEFAPIKAIEWDPANIRGLVNAIDVAWTNLFIPEDNRVILLDKAYKEDVMTALIGAPGTVPVSDKAYDTLTSGKFQSFYGWDWDFSVPSQYYPNVWLDSNLNVVHPPDEGEAVGATKAYTAPAYDTIINSIKATDTIMSTKLTKELAASQRVRATNYIGTYFDPDETDGGFKTYITNYPLSMPSGTELYGDADTWEEARNEWKVTETDATGSTYKTRGQDTFPWQGYPGQGPSSVTAPTGNVTKTRVIGMAVYRPAAQLGEEYGYMETARGGTRGKFTELVFDMKHDAWVIPNLAHGILLIVDTGKTGEPYIPVKTIE